VASVDQDFKATIINIFKELKETIHNESKKGWNDNVSSNTYVVKDTENLKINQVKLFWN
jgi:hypothetical protein